MQRWQKPWAPSAFCTQAAINPGSGLLRYAPMLLTGWTHCLHCWHSRNKKAPASAGAFLCAGTGFYRMFISKPRENRSLGLTAFAVWCMIYYVCINNDRGAA